MTLRNKVSAYIGFGSNQGDLAALCGGAVESLGLHPDIRVVRVSSLYRTRPVGPLDQPWFVNGVLRVETALDPGELLEALLAVERAFGRRRDGTRWGPRTLDLDLLSYDDVILDKPDLSLPHPRLHERLFVLLPLAEIAPDWRHPVLAETARTLCDRLLETARDQEAFIMEDPCSN